MFNPIYSDFLAAEFVAKDRMLVICRRLEIGRHLLISYSELFLWDTLGLISSNFHAYLVLAIHTNEFASKAKVYIPVTINI